MARCVLVSNRRSSAGGQCDRIIDEPHPLFDLHAPFHHLNGFEPRTLLAHCLFSDIPKTAEIPIVISPDRIAVVRCGRGHPQASRHMPTGPRRSATRRPAQTTSLIA